MPDDLDSSNGIIRAFTWVIGHGGLFVRLVRVVQALAGVYLVVLGCYIGNAPFHLIWNGTRAQGQIVDFRSKNISAPPSTNGVRYGGSMSAYMPIVEFSANNRLIRIQDWIGSASGGGLHAEVRVLYDASDPTNAIVDRPIAKWMPWGPILLVGMFLIWNALKKLLTERRPDA